MSDVKIICKYLGVGAIVPQQSAALAYGVALTELCGHSQTAAR